MKKITLIITWAILFSACSKQEIILPDSETEQATEDQISDYQPQDCLKEKKTGINSSIYNLEAYNAAQGRKGNPSLNELKHNLDIIARALLDLTDNQTFKDLVASESKTVPYEESFEVTISHLESKYNLLGGNLLQEMTRSLENNNGTSAEVLILPNIYKGFRLYGNHEFETVIFAPFFDEQFYNQNLIDNNSPVHISFNQAFDKDNMPSYEIANPPA